MGNYDSNYAIAQEISARLGNEPIPFDSAYSICLLIYQLLGGTEQDFDSVYSILLEILPLVDGGISSQVIDDNSISTTKTWSSDKLNTQLGNKQDALTAGSNISISGNTISAIDTIYTAGTNIEISGTTISATYSTASTAEIEALFA